MSSRSVNKVILMGNLAQDAVTSATPSGVSVAKFSVATNRRWKDQASDEWKEEVNYTNVVLWRQESVAPFLVKGKQVYVEGRLQSRSYEKDGDQKYITEVIADAVILLGGGEGAGSHAAPAARPAVSAARPVAATRPVAASRPAAGKSSATAVVDPFGGEGVTDADIPF